ncbi:MAG: hypothetical protein PVF82_20415 [Gammaproteobacteria bacterium]|jgi:hypothetical protein
MDEQVDVLHGLRVLSGFIVFYIIVGRVQRKASGWQVFQFLGILKGEFSHQANMEIKELIR